MSASHGTKIALFISLCSILSACGGPQIDSRNVDWNNGLAYEHGSTDPYTGTLVFKDSIPNNLVRYWSANVSAQGDEAAENVLTGCTEHFTKGVIDGDATCKGQGGGTALTLTFKNERYDGVSKIYNPHTGDLFKKLRWNEGALDGEIETYYYETGKKHSDVYYKSGTQDGRTRVWDKDGEILTDAQFENGTPVDGKVTSAKGTLNYKNGKLDGEAVLNGYSGHQFLSKGEYSEGNREGEWTDWDPAEYKVYEAIENQVVSALNYNPGELGSDHFNFLPDYTISNWSDGQMSGAVKGFSKNGTLLFSAIIKDGKLDGEYQYLSGYQPRRLYTLSFRDGVPVGCVGERIEAKKSDNGSVSADDLKEWQGQCLGATRDSATLSKQGVPPPAMNVVAANSAASPGVQSPSAAMPNAPTPPGAPVTAKPQSGSSGIAADTAQDSDPKTLSRPQGSPAPAPVAATDPSGKPVASANGQATAQITGAAPIHASFDCAKASSAVEKMICANQMLADEDVQLMRVYKEALSATSNRSELKAKQRAWVVERNACTTPECVSGAYQQRIAELGTAH